MNKLTVPQVASLLSVQEAAVRIAIRRKSLAAEKIGRDWFIEQIEADRYAQENAGKTGRPPGSKNKKKRV